MDALKGEKKTKNFHFLRKCDFNKKNTPNKS